MLKKKKSIQDKTYPVWFAFGAIILYTLLYVLPALFGFALSFTDWDAYTNISEVVFVGFANFKIIFDVEENYFKYLNNTLVFAVATTALKSVIALAAALVIDKGLHFKNFHRAAMFFPSIISVVVTGLVFRSILRPEKGLFNQFLMLFGANGTIDWLNNVQTAFASVIFVDVWRGIGYIMIIYLAGLQSISPTYYEAAIIDGAGYWQKLLYITLPLLKQTILVNLMLNAIYGLRVFDIVYVLTRGGPGDLTDVLYTTVFREFGLGSYALGSALSSVMLVILLVVGSICVKYITKQEVDQ